MKLKELHIKDLKCYSDSGKILFHNLTVFIGENDAGKSTILDALDLLLNNKTPRNSENESDSDFRSDSNPIELTATFSVINLIHEIKNFIIKNELKVRKKFLNNGSTKVEVYSEVFENNDLNNFESLNASDLKALLATLELEEKPNQEERKQCIREYVANNPNLPKTQEWKEIKLNEISNFLPIFQRYSSSDYGNPEASIRKTLDIVYRTHFYEQDSEGNETLKANFKTLRMEILDDINEKLKTNLLSHITKYKPEISNIKSNCDIDFAKGLSFSGLNITERSGREKSLNQIGEGSKKKIFLSILEWDSEINLDSASERSIIRGYDEPDANLHYDAQRKMFYVIDELAQNPESNIQAIICTHSLTMIDRASAKSINHVIRDEVGEESKINYLNSHEDEDISDFINQISEISGIKNSSIFYEKCFLLVEGESEQNALPVMYKKYIGRHLSEDGIVLINLQTNGQWSNALKFLHSNKQTCTVLLLDSDTQYSTSNNQVTKKKLEDIGFSSSFLTNNCFFIGDKEFEDSVSDEQYVRICNEKFPKSDRTHWVQSDFSSKRSEKKFSESLKKLLYQQCDKPIGKPEIASATSEILTKAEIEQIDTLKFLFDKIQNILE